eukprot:3732642-Amphidinium_carterae.1
MEQLLIRENVLESTLCKLSHVRGGFGQSSQRYWMDEEETASEWQATEEGAYLQDAPVDNDGEDTASTTSS